MPPTILAQDVLGAMRKGENAIAKKRLTILDRQGRAVAPDSIDWATATPGDVPVHAAPAARSGQRARAREVHLPERALDLPARHAEPGAVPRRRAHVQLGLHPRRECPATRRGAPRGPGRLEPPPRSRRSWTARRPETVFLKQPLPVLIVYWTVSVGASGELRYARDVYNLDGVVLRALNAATWRGRDNDGRASADPGFGGSPQRQRREQRKRIILRFLRFLCGEFKSSLDDDRP